MGQRIGRRCGEEKEGERDDARWRERDTRGRSKRGMETGGIRMEVWRAGAKNPDNKLQSCGVFMERKQLYIQRESGEHPEVSLQRVCTKGVCGRYRYSHIQQIHGHKMSL